MTIPVMPIRQWKPRRQHHSGGFRHEDLHSMAVHWTLFFVLGLLLVLLLAKAASGF